MLVNRTITAVQGLRVVLVPYDTAICVASYNPPRVLVFLSYSRLDRVLHFGVVCVDRSPNTTVRVRVVVVTTTTTDYIHQRVSAYTRVHSSTQTAALRGKLLLYRTAFATLLQYAECILQ